MENKNKRFLFDSKNYKLLLISIFILLVGFFLMSGGGSNDPSEFNPEIYNFRRIRILINSIICIFLMNRYNQVKTTNTDVQFCVVAVKCSGDGIYHRS